MEYINTLFWSELVHKEPIIYKGNFKYYYACRYKNMGGNS